MRFVHIADVHLGISPDAGNAWENSAKQEVYEAFEQLIEELELNPVDFLFITGDLFDHVPDEKDLMWVDERLARLKTTDIIYVTGQSDYLKRDAAIWNYRFLSRTYLLNGAPFKNGVKLEEKPDRTDYAEGLVDCIYFPKHNLDIYGVCQYASQNDRNDLDGVYPHDLSRNSILLAYGGGLHVSPFFLEDFRDTNFSYVGLGHRHNYQTYEEGHLYYAGSLTPLSSEETGEHGYIKGYVDKSLSSFKFVPLKGRRYRTVEVNVKPGEMRDEIQEKLEKICQENPRDVYTIRLNRQPGAYTDYDFSHLRKKYRILLTEGELAAKIDPEELMKLNQDNVLGRHIAFIKQSEEPCAEAAAQRYVNNMIERLSRESLVVKAERFHDVVVEVVDKGLTDAMLKELKETQEELAACDEKKEELEQNLEQYPDVQGEANTLHQRKMQMQYELDQLKFRDNYVDNAFKNNRMKAVLWPVMPGVVFLALLLFAGLVILIFAGQQDTFEKLTNIWWTLLKYDILLSVGGGVLGFVLYNGTVRERNKLFGTKIPAEEHAILQNDISLLEGQIETMTTKETELQIQQEKHEKYMREHKELFKRRVSLAESAEELLLILSYKK